MALVVPMPHICPLSLRANCESWDMRPFDFTVRGQAIQVLQPACRYNTRLSCNLDVMEWVSTTYGVAFVTEPELWDYLHDWFPGHVWDRSPAPCLYSGWSHKYYWLRDVAKWLAFKKPRKRFRCRSCGRRYQADRLSQLKFGGEYTSRGWYCDTRCYKRFLREAAWLKRNRQNLKTMRSWLRQTTSSRAVSPSPPKASEPDTSSQA